MSLSFRHDAGEGMLDRRCALGGYVEIDPTGRYGRFDELLGKGAMKTVYKAFDEAMGTEVAWNQAKLCSVMQSPEVLQRMYSEVHLLSSLRHESVIRIYASWIDVDKMTFNFVTEMFTSGTLREYRQRYPRVDVRAIKSWALQILQGLVYLHYHDPPVIHRDIKCDNILINGHLGQVKIGDFGLAAVLQGSQFAHSIIGTPEFMAPEFYEEEYNELVDIYSFGMCVLEMLTSEYPYSECFNSAQIYKKVTSGKLPDAFYNIQDPEAKRFVGRCLEHVSKRSSANELLLDPFLTIEDINSPLLTLNTIPAYLVKDIGLKDYNCLHLPGNPSGASRSTDMTITGKINMEDNTIFLKVQITDKEGHTRNIYFPFHVASDTPIDVAMEMVKELEIADRKPSEIAEMIAQEVSMLVPDWKATGGSVDLYRVYAYKDDAAEGSNHHFYNLTSTSPQGSLCSDDDHMISHSGKHSLVRYVSADEPAMNFQFRKVQSDIAGKRRCTKLCPRENHQAEASLPNEFHSQCNILPGSSATPAEVKKPLDCNLQLPKNWQMVDVRGYLRRRNLLEQLKKYLFKIIQVIENNEFLKTCHHPIESVGRKASSYKTKKLKEIEACYQPKL